MDCRNVRKKTLNNSRIDTKVTLIEKKEEDEDQEREKKKLVNIMCEIVIESKLVRKKYLNVSK
jgi:hypothetical protein